MLRTLNNMRVFVQVKKDGEKFIVSLKGMDGKVFQNLIAYNNPKGGIRIESCSCSKGVEWPIAALPFIVNGHRDTIHNVVENLIIEHENTNVQANV